MADATSAKSAAAKMHIKSGFTIWAINAPDGYAEILGGLPAMATVTASDDGDVDFVHLFVRSRDELLQELPKVIESAPDKAPVWVSFPKPKKKETPDISRDILMREVLTFGWRSVAGISIDDEWSACRVRPQ
ncbi:hypothetical protein [Saccharopolyspora cebuensis]|uniref:hypothetical protein n=1 Tax=Saccharopolyspora cebuensis TaxID=418759 RepID=UPI0031EAFB84